MGFPAGCPVIDTMIGFPRAGFGQYDFIRRQTKDRSSREEMEFPVEYMFKQVPKDLPTEDPISVTLGVHPVRHGVRPERRDRQRPGHTP